ncbi:hypothetical protein EON80_22485, partial [bacterium]
MSRRSNNSLRNLSFPSLILLAAVIGFRYWQESREAPRKESGRTSRTSSTTTSNRSNNSTQSNSSSSRTSRTSGQNGSRTPSTETSSRSNTATQSNSGENNLLLGNPTSAGQSPDNYLLERPQYSMSYNRTKGGPNWVAWHTDASDLGDTERGKFVPDPELPAGWQIRPADYKGTGYDRGHLCPSGDRT